MATTVATPTDRGELWLRVSPRGKRSGFVALGDGAGGTVTLTVLPKFWSGSAQTYAVKHEPGAATHVVVHELDTLRVDATLQGIGSITLNLASVNEQGERELIAISRPTPETPEEVRSQDSESFNALLDLLNIAERSGLRALEGTFEGSHAESFMRALTYRRFLGLLEPLLFRARPRYVELTEDLTSPRGRLNDQSLLLAQASGRPVVTSTFDELTMDTPVLRVVKAALRSIAEDRLPASVSVLAARTESHAAQLGRHLSHVTTIPADTALSIVPRVWLSPLERAWQPVLDAAVEVLTRRGPIPADEDITSDAYAAHVMTEKFWEQAVTESLKAAFGAVSVSADKSPGPGVSAPTPWTPPPGTKAGSDTTYPDYMFRSDVEVVVADAKYKRSATVGSDDGYQLFTYSHLARLDDAASTMAVLLFPSSPDTDGNQVCWQRRSADEYPLWVGRLPYPSRDDVASTSAWARYVARNARLLRQLSEGWSR